MNALDKKEYNNLGIKNTRMQKNDVREIWVTVNVTHLLSETGCDPGNCGPLPYIQIKIIRVPK